MALNYSAIFTVRHSSCGKAMFSGASVCPQGGVHGEGGHAWQREGMHGKGGRGTCVAKGCVYGSGPCMTGETANPTGMHSGA